MPTKGFLITYMAQIIFVLDSDDLELQINPACEDSKKQVIQSIAVR